MVSSCRNLCWLLPAGADAESRVWKGRADIELEVTGFQRQQFTEDQERAAVQSAVSRVVSSCRIPAACIG